MLFAGTFSKPSSWSSGTPETIEAVKAVVRACIANSAVVFAQGESTKAQPKAAPKAPPSPPVKATPTPAKQADEEEEEDEEWDEDDYEYEYEEE